MTLIPIGFWFPDSAEVAAILLILLGQIFWVWMLVDCAINKSLKDNEKFIWVIVIALSNLLGAVIYFFIRRPRRSSARLK